MTPSLPANTWDSLAKLVQLGSIEVLDFSEVLSCNTSTVKVLSLIKRLKKVTDSTWAKLAAVVEPGSLERMEIIKAQCPNEATVAPMMKMLNDITSWNVGKLTLGEGLSSMSNLRCETDGRLQCDTVKCYSSGALSILCKILQTCNRWSLGELYLGSSSSSMTSDSWSQLAAVAGRGEIDKVELNKSQIQRGRREDVEAVKRVTREWKERSW